MTLSKKQRLKELERLDTYNQLLRYEKECGELKIRQATPEELEKYRKYRKDYKNGKTNTETGSTD